MRASDTFSWLRPSKRMTRCRPHRQFWSRSALTETVDRAEPALLPYARGFGIFQRAGELKHREFAMAYGEMSGAQFTNFLTRACALLAENSVSGSLHYICMDWRHLGELLSAGKAV